MTSRSATAAVSRLVEILVDCAEAPLRHRILLEAALGCTGAQAAGLYRRGAGGDWHLVLARGELDLLATSEEVASSAEDGGPNLLAPARAVLHGSASLALALGGLDVVDADALEERLDAVEGLLLVFAAVEADETTPDPVELPGAVLPPASPGFDTSDPPGELFGDASSTSPTVEARRLAHDLRNLLTGVGLSHGTAHGEQLVERECRRAADLLLRAGDSSAPEGEGTRATPAAGDDVLQAVTDVLQVEGTLFKQAGLVLEIRIQVEADAMPALALPPSAWARVVRNLVGNAREALGGAGTRACVELHRSSGPRTGVVLRVEDDGPGLPAELPPQHVFVEGTSTRGPHRGTGLAVVKSLVRDGGGCVRAVDRPQGGARFEVFVPARGTTHG